MKKLFALVLMLTLILSLCACNNEQFPNEENHQSQNGDNQQTQNGNDSENTKFKLTVIDYWGYLVKPLNEYYKAGEEVEVTLAFLSGPSVGIELNGEYIGENSNTKYDGVYPIITFTMPAKDSVLYTTQNGNIGFLSTFSRAGSGRDPDIWNNALNASKLHDSNPWNLPIYKFDTLSDLEKFKRDFGGENGFVYGWDEVPSFNDVTKNYDEYFFERYTLMLVCIEASSGSYRFGFKDVTINDNYFCIHIEQTNDSQGGTDDMAAWFITVAVPDSMIENCTDFDADLVSNKLKEISSITDKSYEFGILEWNEIFYSDRHGFYMFVGKFSEHIIVSYTDGTTENVKNALRNGHIQISDLDEYDIEYYVQSMSQMLSSIAHFSLSLDDLKAMVERYGESLTWSNFDRYYSYKTSSGLKVLYRIDEYYSLLIYGDSTTSSPDYIYLVYKGNMDNRIDVRYESIDEFVNKMAELEASNVAKAVTDYENYLKNEIDKLHEEHPEYNYYYHPVDEVHCTYILNSNASADAIVEKYNMTNVFAKAEVSALNAIKMISIIFDRNDFTEAMHQKIKQISEEESLIENLFVDMQRDWVESYMPKIEYYTDYETVLNYEITNNILKLEKKGFIIKSKEEYDNYLDDIWGNLIYTDTDLKETISRQKNSYNEAFFEENALIITNTITRGSGSIQLTVDNLYVSENKVYVVVRTDVPGVGTDDMQYTSFTLVVPKSEVIDVNEVITLE